ncbi:MAG: aminodeoxychorismate synthase, component I [Candidatus Fischerbacteria bacterium RBG_13_37_8]|uniref:aminodeoxychorismate synthase n=1 Tax=Candidatus Fischerbacteria bacterium RBG_13_37_8 TaxID=1817863 RepID=A0A1F5VFK1_9BACT|nr:MAG: aminodeoxychorismate synthase, component I [Candidatus Fischerbacteria bacterium RBG_13_37_8]
MFLLAVAHYFPFILILLSAENIFCCFTFSVFIIYTLPDMLIDDVSNRITFAELIHAVRNEPYSFIIDKYREEYSLAGFALSLPDKSNLITTNSIDEFETTAANIIINRHKAFENTKEYFSNNRNGTSHNSIPAGPGWYGYISYNLNAHLNKCLQPKPCIHPLINFIYMPAVFYISHHNEQIVCLAYDKNTLEHSLAIIKNSPVRKKHNFSLKNEYVYPLEKYKQTIEQIKEHIINGDVYQVNFTHQMIFSFKGDELGCYLAMRESSRSAQGGYFKFSDMHILSFSPERFFKIMNGNIASYPIKGTMPRSSNQSEDESYRLALQKSAKDHAEHIMIVDLIRNDLGRISRIGSVHVEDLCNIESFETVHHMVSCIRGTLNDNLSVSELLKAISPGGSITGAPKIAAMKIIDELEDYSREIYTGNIGYIIPEKNILDFNIAIRTLLIHKGQASYAVGGGIVFDSDPCKEYEETLIKSRILNLAE